MRSWVAAPFKISAGFNRVELLDPLTYFAQRNPDSLLDYPQDILAAIGKTPHKVNGKKISWSEKFVPEVIRPLKK